MSREALELITSLYDAISRRDWGAFADALDTDMEFEWPPDVPGATNYRGRDQAVAGLMRYLVPWSEYEITPLELVPLGNRVFVPNDHRAVAKKSGIVFERRFFHVWTLEGGKVVRVQVITDESEARKAAGLPE
jgi:ketosteroid isomerase-like protein